MALRINNNISSLNVQRNLNRQTAALRGNFEKLSSGLRINRASDDAAGLAISERLRAQIASLRQAERNASDGISLVQTAEGALGEMSSMLVRMRELSTQAANGTLSAQDRTALDNEFQALEAEINRIANTTDFAGIDLLNGATSLAIRVDSGTTAGTDSITVSLVTMTAAALTLDSLAISSAASADAAITAIDTAISTVSSKRSQFGALQNRLESTISNLSNRVVNFISAESRIRDVDVAMESANFVQNQILQQAATAILAQANIQPQLALSLLV